MPNLITSRIVRALSATVVALATMGPAHAETAREWTDRFLTALNSGDPATMLEFNHGSERDRDYMFGIHQEIGPLEIESERGGVMWSRGTLTDAIIGIKPVEREGRWILGGVQRGGAPERPVPLAPLRGAALSDHLSAWLARAADAGFFSGSVVVAAGEGRSYEGAFGLADRESGKPNTIDTRIRVGSVTKMLVAVAVLRLAQDGRLALDEPIARLIPEYPAHIAGQVTVHHLLTHTSGIELDGDEEFNRMVREANSLDEVLAAHVARIEHLNSGNYADFRPLTRHDYSNENYDLLGVIIERASRRPWTEYIRSVVFEPAGMTSTGFVDERHPVEGLAVGYSFRTEGGGYVIGPRRRVTAEVAKTARPAGSAYSTTADLVRFGRALLEHRLLDAAHTDRMLSPQAPVMAAPQFTRSYGYGAVVHEENGLTTVGHNGSFYGLSAAFEMEPAKGTVVVVLSNFDGWTAQGVAARLWELARAE